MLYVVFIVVSASYVSGNCKNIGSYNGIFINQALLPCQPVCLVLCKHSNFVEAYFLQTNMHWAIYFYEVSS